MTERAEIFIAKSTVRSADLEHRRKINFTKRGGKVIWAETTEQAIEEILAICKAKNCKTLVKSKSMATEEIHLNDALGKHGIESVETDLGEYIQQLDGEAPYHIVTPAMHKSKEDVARLFNKKLGTPINYSPEELTQVARKILRKKYTQAEVGVTGANFIIMASAQRSGRCWSGTPRATSAGASAPTTSATWLRTTSRAP